MPRHTRNKPLDFGPHASQQLPATEIAAAAGLYPSDRNSFDYTRTLQLKERLIEICKRCTIRFGLPDQARKHIGEALDLPMEPVLRYPHRDIPIDPRWEALANALRFPPPQDFPLVHLEVFNSQDVQAIKSSLPSLLEDIGLQQQARHGSSRQPLLHPIPPKWGELLRDKLEKVRTYGDQDAPNDNHNREHARNMHRQMRIYIALGSTWTLVNSLESMALYACSGINPDLQRPAGLPRSPKPQAPPLHTTRRNLTGEMPLQAPESVLGLRWMWVRHEGAFLPPTWGAPQNTHWGRWEPQFPKTSRPNTSLFGQSSRYLEIDLNSNQRRDGATREFLESLQQARVQFETLSRGAERTGGLTERFEAALRSQLIKEQDEALDSYIRRVTRR